MNALTDNDERWAGRLVAILILAAIAREAINALNLAPLHFDEAQYWTYGQALGFGYYSKPPLVGWLIRLSTEVLGDTAFGVRFFAPVAHGLIGWLLFATGRRLFDARAGFWAGLAYTALPGVTVSSSLMTTDPVMMTAWAFGLYALVRVLEGEREGRPDLRWWVATGMAIGVGMLAKYTMIAFALCGLGYALFSREGGRRAALVGPLLAALCALAVLSPNLWWNAQHHFATIAHVGDNVNLGRSLEHPGKAGEFFGAQFGVFGPVLMAALLWMVWRWRSWVDEWRFRLLMWFALPLPVVMTAQAFISRAHPNWAAPAYVAASLAVATWLLDRQRRGWLVAHLAVATVAFAAYWGAGALYAVDSAALPRFFDPFKKMRAADQFCAIVLSVMTDQGVSVLLSDDRRRLADCMFRGGLGLDRIAILNYDGVVGNHYELTSSLQPGDARPMILALMRPAAQTGVLARFAEHKLLAAGEIRTHADRTERYSIYRVRNYAPGLD